MKREGPRAVNDTGRREKSLQYKAKTDNFRINGWMHQAACLVCTKSVVVLKHCNL